MMDWQTGRRGGPTSPVAEVIFAGDWAPIRRFAPLMAAAPAAVYGDLLPLLRLADYRIVNLECPLDGSRETIKSGTVFRGGPEYLAALQAIAPDLVTLANNHVFDFGLEGLTQTQALLRRAGIAATGAGATPAAAAAPYRFRCRNLSFAVLAIGEGEDMTDAADGPGVFGWRLDEAERALQGLRAEGVLPLVVLHAGLEYIPSPPPYIVAAAHRLAAAGAAAVVAHHPHVPQGIEWHRGVPIAYSLGNFVFYQETRLKYRKLGYLLQLGFAAAGCVSLQIHPYHIGDDGLSQLHGNARQEFLDLLRRLSELLPGQADDAWHGFLKYYGLAGFKNEVARIMQTLSDNPGKGAAMFRNRLLTPQHREHWRDFLDRTVRGTLDQAPDWATRLAADFFTVEE